MAMIQSVMACDHRDERVSLLVGLHPSRPAHYRHSADATHAVRDRENPLR